MSENIKEENRTKYTNLAKFLNDNHVIPEWDNGYMIRSDDKGSPFYLVLDNEDKWILVEDPYPYN